ncbi:MAG: proton-conducting membrane transporter [Clostridia bacterium]|nr:proton-conducting membrane transporter [Clostridia bacterium]
MLLPLCAILLPLAGGCLVPVLRFRSGRARSVWVFCVTLCTSVLTFAAILTRSAEPTVLFEILPGMTVALHIDGPGLLFAGLAAALWPLAVLYAFSYMEHEERPDRFFAWYTISYAATLAIAFSATLLTLYIFYECLTLATLPLVNHKDDRASRKAGLAYALWTIGGAAVGFAALMFTLRYGRGESFFALGGVLKTEGAEDLLRWVFLLAFVGFGAKAAVFPFHIWLPKASVAPTPVTALLHAVAVVNAGAFAVIRIIYYVFGPSLLQGTFAQTAALALSCFTILLGASMAVREQHLKRRLAWSTVSNLSYMLMGASLMTPEGQVGAMTHLVCHGLMKITLFYCAGAILVRTGKEYVQDIRGFAKPMPFICACFTIAAAALVGVPPLCGFVSKWQLLTAATATGLPMGIAATVTIIVAAVLTAVYLFEPVMSMYFRPLNEENRALAGEDRDPDFRMLVPIGLICVMIVLAGLCAEPLLTLLRGIAAGTV